ncbi:sigma-70 family RNA polymerase sigma factor, partial [Actinomadura kijaniata]|uniref:sigma-70 family RNA polymerase sigma factor n=1 Tax=Actinomadura kijaniata TaxID=46161 RepID=UPI003F193BDC
MGKAASGTAPTETTPEPSDAVLIARIRAGDSEALGPLFERHRTAARRLAGHLIGGDAADDAVQNAFEKVLDAIRRGGGPRSGFRPYLLTAVRNSVYDMYRDDRRLHTTDRMEQFDPGLPFDDPALEGLERTMIVQAYRSLPERWRTVLWHTVVEGAGPADVAPLLGLTPNGAAALAYRAREGLRQAYLQMHLARERTAEHAAPGVAAGAAVTVDARCRPVLDKLGAYVRDGLARRDARKVEEHLDDCARCQAIHAELADVNTTLREALGPVVLGTAGVAYLAAKAGVAGGGILGWFRHLPKRQQQALGAGALHDGVPQHGPPAFGQRPVRLHDH